MININENIIDLSYLKVNVLVVDYQMVGNAELIAGVIGNQCSENFAFGGIAGLADLVNGLLKRQ